jgi:hypothetical protein
MHASPTAPAEANAADPDRATARAPAPAPEWLIRLLARLILFMLSLRSPRTGRVPSWWEPRLDLPAGSIQELAAAVRGNFGSVIKRLCLQRGIGPGHPEWPYLARSIVAFGGSLAGLDGRICPREWWESQWILPAVFAAEAPSRSAVASLLARQDAARLPSPPPPAARSTTARQAGDVAPRFAGAAANAPPHFPPRAGTGPPTGPPTGAPARRAANLPSRLTHGAGTRPAPPFRFVPPADTVPCEARTARRFPQPRQAAAAAARHTLPPHTTKRRPPLPVAGPSVSICVHLWLISRFSPAGTAGPPTVPPPPGRAARRRRAVARRAKQERAAVSPQPRPPLPAAAAQITLPPRTTKHPLPASHRRHPRTRQPCDPGVHPRTSQPSDRAPCVHSPAPRPGVHVCTPQRSAPWGPSVVKFPAFPPIGSRPAPQGR